MQGDQKKKIKHTTIMFICIKHIYQNLKSDESINNNAKAYESVPRDFECYTKIEKVKLMR